eukprot:1194718-Prorocentrum_minimum.AAC.3
MNAKPEKPPMQSWFKRQKYDELSQTKKAMSVPVPRFAWQVGRATSHTHNEINNDCSSCLNNKQTNYHIGRSEGLGESHRVNWALKSLTEQMTTTGLPPLPPLEWGGLTTWRRLWRRRRSAAKWTTRTASSPRCSEPGHEPMISVEGGWGAGPLSRGRLKNASTLRTRMHTMS